MPDNIKVKFGLVQQGHIATIEAEIERWSNLGGEFQDMTYAKAMWDSIGQKIGWCPFTAALHYFEYRDSTTKF